MRNYRAKSKKAKLTGDLSWIHKTYLKEYGNKNAVANDIDELKTSG